MEGLDIIVRFYDVIYFTNYFHFHIGPCSYVRKSIERHKLGVNKKVGGKWAGLYCYIWQYRVENEHYSVAYFDRITALEM